MIKFLVKHRFKIIFILVLTATSFWFIPKQEELYLPSDFELLESKSNRVFAWLIGIAALVILIIVLRQVKDISEGVTAFFSTALLAIPIYLFFQSIFLSLFLLINRIEYGGRVDKKYTAIFFMREVAQTPKVLDFRTGDILFSDNIRNRDILNDLKPGDTVIISFSKGLLGFNLNPAMSRSN